MDRPGLFDAVPDEVSIVEVALRDGLQNEPAVVPLEGKRRIAEAIVRAGVRRVELTSFVSPRWVPQLADAEDLCHAVRAPGGVVLSALCPNARGLDRAIAAGVQEIAVFLSASETHNRKNVNRSIADTLAVFREIVPPARDAGLRVRGYVSTVWGCPYEGDVDPARAAAIAKNLVEMGCYQVSIGDTIGCGTPRQTDRIVRLCQGEIGTSRIALHLHDTRGAALANALVALELGVRDFDAALGGLGGCPYAPGASGNVATEDLVFLLHGMGVRTGIDLERLVEAGRIAEAVVGRTLPGRLLRAGTSSRRRAGPPT